MEEEEEGDADDDHDDEDHDDEESIAADGVISNDISESFIPSLSDDEEVEDSLEKETRYIYLYLLIRTHNLY